MRVSKWSALSDDDIADFCADLIIKYGCVAFAVGAVAGFLFGLWVG